MIIVPPQKDENIPDYIIILLKALDDLGINGDHGYIFNDKYFKGLERTSDPPQPSEGSYVIWMSDGTGKGDDGDVLIASTAGGVTNYGTLFDHSGGGSW